MKNFVELIFSHNRPFNDKPAVIDENATRLTGYTELYEKSCAVAAYAKENKLSGVVPVCMPRRVETVEVLLGLGLAGVGVAPLSDHTPDARVRVIEEQTENAVFTMDRYKDAMSFLGKQVEPVDFADDAPAYVVFTSGSTGMPKGVMLSNETVERSYKRMASSEYMNLKRTDNVLQHASISFVALMIDLFAPLYAGCTTHILPEEMCKDPKRMTEYINTHSIHCTFFMPKFINQVGDIPSVKVVIIGGERVSNVGPKGYKLINAWGMSETAALASGYSIPAPMEKTPIGKPTGGFRFYILDDDGNPSEEGEICVSGPIAMGYYKLPEQTRKTFEKNPFTTDEGHRTLLHTGDIVRKLPDGNLLYISRKDFMIKINGQRVEPGEAEGVLTQIDGIQSAVVKGFTDEDGHSFLCAYYTADKPVSEDTMRKELEKQLPQYMVPSFYVKLDALPLNANGKLDRLSLKAPQVSLFHSEYAPATTEQEAALVKAFEKTLHIDRIGINDDFFRLGGDSIRAMTVVCLADIPGLDTADVLNGKTPKEIAELCKKKAADPYANCSEKPQRVRLTDSQMGIYLECASALDNIKYNIPFSVSFPRTEKMTGSYIKDCVDRVLNMHPALTACIKADSGEIYMLRNSLPDNGICSAVEVDSFDEEAEWEGFVQPFDLGTSPLCRARAILTKDKVRLLLDTHHIVSDGSSVAALVKELVTAFSGGTPDSEKVDAFALFDIQQKLKKENEKNAGDHFAAMLSGVETDSNLLFDKKSDLSDAPAERVTLTVDTPDLSNLKRNGITESSFFMAVFGYTLSKMTGQNESLFAVAESGRKSALLEHTVSMLVRTLPVYMHIDESKSPLELMKNLKEQFYASVENDSASYRELCNTYDMKPDVMFVYQSDMLSGGMTALGQTDISFRPTNKAISNLSVSVFRYENRHNIVLEYRSDLYEKETIERFANVFKNTVTAFSEGKLPKSIPLIREEDLKFLDSLNATECPFNENETMVDIFRRQAKAHSDKTCLICEGRSYTYRQADEITDRIAGYIHSLGIGKGEAVSVLIQRSEYLFLCGMGIQKSGAMYQPLDPSYPSDRLSFMRKDAASRLLIADRDLLSILEDFDGRVLFTDEIPGLPDFTGHIEAPRPEDGFILLYTSGTTGLPKGCMLKHLNLTAMVNAYAHLTKMEENSIAAAYASYGFDAHMADLYPILFAGGTLVIVPDSIRLDLLAIRDYCEGNRVSHLILTTQLAVQFALAYKKLNYLKCLVAGGEKMVSLNPPETYRLLNCYGPTECTVLETMFDVDAFYDDIPIGKALENAKLYVVDPQGRRVPPGVPGELVISGPQVAVGYLNRPEQTQKAFVKNTFEPVPVPGYERCYRTGDIVRYLPDGNLVFIGRRDMQVKIRGFRIELSEVERVIMDYPGVKHATVVACDAPAGGKCLNAYVVGDEPVDIEKLHAYIRSVKPPYMVPAATMQIDSIPLTVNGKVDKRKLPKMEVRFDDVTKPETELQKQIFDLAVQTVGTEAFGIHTDLFEAGLSSLGSIRLCSLLADTFNIPVQLRILKKYETVAKLENFINKARGTEEVSSEPSSEKTGEKILYGKDHPISKTMEGIFTECIAKPDSTFYNIPYLLKLAPNTDEAKLKKALVSAVEAHPCMKAELFTDTQGRVRQHRRLDDAYTEDCIKIRSAAQIDELKSTLIRPFKITDGQLFEICLIHADGLYLFFDFHHIIADGTSVSVFLNDVEKAYCGKALSEEIYTAFDAAEDEQKARTDEDLKDAQLYYETLLCGLDHEFLPLSDMYPDSVPSEGRLILKQRLADPEAIKDFCIKHRVSANAFFVSAFGYVLSRYAGSDYSVFNTIYNGRNDSRSTNTFGMLVKTLPVVFESGSSTCLEAVEKMGSQLMESMANDLYSYGEIVRNCGISSDTMFIFQGNGFERRSFLEGECEEVGLSLSDAKTPLALQAILKNGEIVYDLEYDPNRFSEKLMEAFVYAFDAALSGFCKNEALSTVSLLSKEAQAEMEHYNNTEFDYDRSRTITQMFLENVHKYPKKLCVAFKGKRLSYAKAGELSGKIAGHLMKNGIGIGDVVPILIERSEEMVITAHGAVRAGAAYLGLDASYPTDRLEFMIKDCGARTIIADRKLMDRIPGYHGKVLYTDEIESLRVLTEKEEADLREKPEHRITPESDALVVYSSGTTGVPKGSVLQHKAIVCFFENYTKNTGMDEHSHVATYASFGFDGGAMDVFSVPMVGASLYVIPDEIRMDLSSLEQFYVRNVITHGFMTTQVGTMFISNTKCRSLRHFMVGGEKFIPVTAPDWVHFQNGYGPSETMCYVNCYDVKNTAKLQPIGSVSGNTKEYIIDKDGNRLPFGACGELCISGGQMGRGYLGRPEKTAQVFVENPFSDKKGYEKMYRTGDVVRMLPDGNYDFVGRNDGQVKIRGFRIELGEVEMQIRKFPGVASAVVTAFDSPAGGKYLAAYVVSEDTLSVEKLKSFIAAEKPDYMVPAAIMQIDAIPLTSNGKVDLRKLPKPEFRTSHKGAEPDSPTEQQICSIFASVLGLEKVYADDDFFSIGGSSISAIQVIVKCEQAGMAIVYKNLFANPTAQKLAGFLQGGNREDIVATQLESEQKHNYSALAYNTEANLPHIQGSSLGDVLLTGATGFLGSHVFRELLDSTSGNVICLIRSKNGMSAQERLEMMMVYYFEEWYGEEQSARVRIIDGDIEEQNLSEKLENVHFDTIINCAANVKHFAAGNELIGSNFSGVENLIRIAEAKNARLIQTSSISVCGESVNGSVPEGYIFRETDLNIGQSLENKYVYSKYLAEQALIDAVSDKRVRGKVIRLGNLMARADDSEFQVNAGTNAFLRMFIGFNELGCFPIGMMDAPVEFSPIDAVAKAVVLLSGTPDEFTVFHAKNCNTIHYGYFISALKNKIRPIEIVEDAVFDARLNKAFENEKNVDKLGGLLAYRNEGEGSVSDTVRQSNTADFKKESRIKIASDTSFTTKALYRLGFAWPLISEEYLNKMVDVLSELNFFTED